MNYIFKLIITMTLLCPYYIKADIPILYVDQSGAEQTASISEIEYENMTYLKSKNSLEVANNYLTQDPNQLNGLELKGILVGLEVFNSVGFGAINIAAGINQQFYFEFIK